MPARHMFNEGQISELEKAYKTHKDTIAGNRVHLVLLFAQGMTYAEVRKATGYSEARVSQLVSLYARKGLEELVGNPHRSRKPPRKSRPWVYKPGKEEIISVEAALKSASDPWEKRRLTVILLSLKKVPMKTIMHETQYSDVHIRRLREEYVQKGLDKYLAHKYRPYRDEKLWSKEFTPEQIEEVQKAYETATHPVLSRRYKVVLLRMQGMTNKQAAKETGMAKCTSADALCAYKKYGLAALQAHAATKIYAPRASKFTEEQAQEVLHAFYHARRLKDKAKLEILVLRSQNKTFQEIHEATGFSMGAITREINNYLQHGLPKFLHGGGVLY